MCSFVGVCAAATNEIKSVESKAQADDSWRLSSCRVTLFFCVLLRFLRLGLCFSYGSGACFGPLQIGGVGGKESRTANKNMRKNTRSRPRRRKDSFPPSPPSSRLVSSLRLLSILPFTRLVRSSPVPLYAYKFTLLFEFDNQTNHLTTRNAFFCGLLCFAMYKHMGGGQPRRQTMKGPPHKPRGAHRHRRCPPPPPSFLSPPRNTHREKEKSIKSGPAPRPR